MMQNLERQFFAWLQQQPPDETYDYKDPRNCPITQFLRSLGFPDACAGATVYTLDVNRPAAKIYMMPLRMNDAVAGEPRTFGAATIRLANALYKGKETA